MTIKEILQAHWAKRGRPKRGKLHPQGLALDDEIDLCEENHFGNCEAWARCRICNPVELG